MPDNHYHDDWPFGRNITIPSTSVGSDQTDPVITVDLGAILPSDDDVWTYGDENGDDLRVTDSSFSELPIEVIHIDLASKKLVIRFKWSGTLSSSSNNDWKFFFGNIGATAYGSTETFGRENVYNSNYVAVFNFEEDPSGTAPQMIDSTSGSHDGTSGGTMLTGDLVAGVVGNGLDFDATDDTVTVPDHADFDFGTGAFTLQCWGNRAADVGSDNTVTNMIAKTEGNFVTGFTLAWGRFSGSQKVYFADRAGAASAISLTAAASPATNQWDLYTAVRTTSSGHLYINGAQVDSVTSITPKNIDTAAALTFSGVTSIGVWGAKKLDDIRISNVALSADWISDEYDMTNDPATFFTVGDAIVKPQWYDRDWTGRVEITLQSPMIDADLTDYPAYIDLGQISSGHTFWATVDTAGDDLVITKGNQWERLPLEVVAIDTTGKTGEIHTQITGTLSSTVDTSIYIYYGNGTATQPAEDATYGREGVWNSGYVGVWHINETSGSALDSTSNDNDGTYNGTMPNQVAGQLGSGQDFNGTSDYIQISDSASLDLTSAMTLSTWTYAGTDAVTFPVIISKAPVNTGYSFLLQSDDDPIGRVNISTVDKDAEDQGVVISRSTWESFSITHDSTNIKMYRSGALAETTAASGSQDTTSGDLYFGNADGTSGNRYVGRLDEIRLSNVDRGLNWISTEYNNQNSPSTFYVVGAHETEVTPWYDSDFRFRIKVTTQHEQVTADQTDFPIYGNLGDIPNTHQFWGVVDSAGGDLVVCKSDGTTRVSLEVVDVDVAGFGGELHWTSDGTLSSSTNTDWYVYYGNASATQPAEDATYGREGVWDSNHILVGHLEEDGNTTAGGYLDSTSNDYDGTGVSTVSTEVSAQVGRGQHLDGGADYINWPSGIDLTSSWTYGVWANRDASGVLHVIWNNYQNSSTGRQFQLYVDATDEVHVNVPWFPDVIVTTSGLVGTGWHHIVATKTGTTWKLFIDGSEDSSVTDSQTQEATTDQLRLGVQHNNGSYDSWFDGIVDEARVSDTDRSSTWISTEYNNQSAPETFNVWGEVEVYQWAHAYNDVDYGRITEIHGKELANVRMVAGVW